MPLCTLMCLNIGTPKSINFPFVPNGNLMFLVSQYLSIIGYDKLGGNERE